MKTLICFALLFILLNEATSAEAQCTPEKIRRCCINLCIDPYCNTATGVCACNSPTLFKEQCSTKCTADQIKKCCTLRCAGPYCDELTGSCKCGDNIKLSTKQCSVTA